MANTLRSYSAYWGQASGNTGSGLDQVIGWITRDPGLAGNTEASALAEGIQAANGLNQLIINGLNAIGSINDVWLDSDDIRRLNTWLRSDAGRKDSFEMLHGDDEGGVATGFHTIQNDGANQKFRGLNLIDTVLDGIYHFGFEINANNEFLNEDGSANAALADVASWLTSLKIDYATTNTNLDRTTELIIGDKGLGANINWADIAAGATAANNLNILILQGIAALNVSGQADSDNTRLSSSEVRWINQWIKADQTRTLTFLTNHGDDENGSETGFHLVQNDGASTVFFGKNLVNTVLDGIYHIGFSITSDDRFQNEDGDANANVSDVADWLTYFYSDQSTTGTGLDRIVDTIKLDYGLSRNTSAADINGGAEAANKLNQLILRALAATGVYGDQWLTRSELRKVNQWIKTYDYPLFLNLHGDDENGEETGFHLVQNDGAETQYFGKNLVNTVADGIYHIGFLIDGENFQNEDGDTNASLSDVSAWLNYFLGSRRVTFGTDGAENFVGNQESEQVLAYGGNDAIDGAGGNDLLDGSWGNDTLLGGAGEDILDGAFDNDLLDGGQDSDTYLVSGTKNGGWSSFNGFDIYADSGTSGTDRILAEGVGPVDIGVSTFLASNGIEEIVNGTTQIDGTPGTAEVTLLGDWKANSLDFSSVSFLGSNFLIDGGDGNDSITGSALADRIKGGRDADLLDGKAGSDTYEVSGNGPDWVSGVPYTFHGYDTYQDTGSTSDTDSILATGSSPVDIGLTGFSSSSGIERIINATSGSLLVRLLGDWKANSLDFSSVSFLGSNFLIDGGDGNDSISGSALADRIKGGRDADLLDGKAGSDTITGGMNMDQLRGGAGADTFTYTNLQDGLWTGGSTFERVSDFVIGNDRFDLDVLPTTIQTLGSASALSCNAIASLLNSTVFVASGVATFSYTGSGGTRTFIAFNDTTAGFNQNTDALVEITGYSYAQGSSSLSQITLV
ncbi:MAG: bluetail domain-containing putative surface protein [Cyanobacteriota bacterium]